MKDFNNIRLPQGSYFIPTSGKNLPGIAVEDLVSYFLNKWGFPLINTCCYAVTPTDGQAMVYNSTTKKIEFRTVTSGGLGTNITNTPTSSGITLISSTGTGSILPLATSSLAGLMSPTQVTKLASIPTPTTVTTNQVYFGNNTTSPTSSSDFTWNDTTKVLYINGKISMTGLIDPPTGLELQLRATNPGGITANTLWLNSTTNHLMRGSVDLETLGGAVNTVFGRSGTIVATSGDYTTTLVTEGTNLYYTNARGIGSTLTGFVSGAGTVTSSDTILTALQKISGNIAASGTVTNLSIVSANGFNGTVATSTTTPAITLSTSITGILKGDGTAILAATSGTDYLAPNTAITGATKTKITYDSKGLVTSGTDATSNDILTSSSLVIGGTTYPAGTSLTTINSNLATAVNTGIPTNLALGTTTSTTQPITNSNGTGFVLPVSTPLLAGLESAADKAKSDLITVTGATNLDTLKNDVQTLQTDLDTLENSLSTISGASVVNTPSGSVSATTVQGAINELDAEKQGNLTFQEEGVATGVAGSVQTINIVGSGITVTQSGSVLTITSTNLDMSTIVAYDDPIAAGVGLVPIGGVFEASLTNTMGVIAGTLIRRRF